MASTIFGCASQGSGLSFVLERGRGRGLVFLDFVTGFFELLVADSLLCARARVRSERTDLLGAPKHQIRYHFVSVPKYQNGFERCGDVVHVPGAIGLSSSSVLAPVTVDRRLSSSGRVHLSDERDGRRCVRQGRLQVGSPASTSYASVGLRRSRGGDSGMGAKSAAERSARTPVPRTPVFTAASTWWRLCASKA